MKPGELARVAGEVLLGRRDAADLPPEDQHTLLDFLVRGKCLLFAREDEGEEAPSVLRIPALASEVLREKLAAERERCDRQRHALLEAQALLARADIPLLLFKTWGPYPYASSNVDALVPEGALMRAVQELEIAGYHEMTHYWEPNKRLVRRFQGRECSLELHLHERVSWIVLAFLDTAALWSRARSSSDPGVRHPAPEHLVAALLAHSVYESNRVNVGDVEKIRIALAHDDFDWSEVVRNARTFAWLPGLALARLWYAAAERAAFGDSLLDDLRCREDMPRVSRGAARDLARAIARGDWPVALGKRRLKTYYFRKLLRARRRSAAEKLRDLAGVASQIIPGRLGLRHRPGSFVCLCGIDGSGKSSQAEAAIAALRECEIPSHLVWMRGGYAPATEAVKRLLRRASRRIPTADDAKAKVRVYRSGPLRWFWAWWVAGEQILGGLLRIRVPRWLGRTAIAERFVPDTLADLTERLGDPDFADRVPARLMARLAPQPDLILLLDLPGDVAFARKPDDWSPEVLEERRQLYRRIVARHPQVVVLDARHPLAELEHEVVDRVLSLVLGRIAERNPLSTQRRDGWE